MEDIILYFSLKYNGDFAKIYSALAKKEEIDHELKDRLFQQVKCHYTTIFSDDYPLLLKNINCPPFVLYYYGNLDLINDKTIAVIGTRKPSEYGIYCANKLTNELVKNNYTIVSGLALGIDSIAHKQTIESLGNTIAVLPTGIEYCYPIKNKEIYEEIKKNHLLISEYPFVTTPKRELFSFRNRIVAALSDSILVVEANNRSGTMVSVGYGLEQGKNIYAVPSRITDYPGANSLIQQGAKLIMNIEDILEEEYCS